MKYGVKIKKIFLASIFMIFAMVLFLTIHTVLADINIDTTVTKYKYEDDDIYYSDGYFKNSATEYNSHLASLSILMAKFSMNPGNPKNKDDTDWYLKQSNRVKGFLELIGFNDFSANEDYKTRTKFDTIGIACASKKVGDYTVISVAVRSGGYFLEWSNNVWLGDGTKSDYMHEGWYNAAKKLLSHLEGYIKSSNITGKIKLWMAGYSRGGAVTNIAAGLLDNYINGNKDYIPSTVSLNHNDLYAYTFEAPQGANINSKNVKAPKDDIYNNIWNIVNPNDLVTKVAMSGFGFTRFGTDKFITTKFYDSANFTDNRNVFKKIYGKETNADKFEMRGITGDKIAGILANTITGGPIGGALVGYLTSKTSGLTSKDNTKANYDGNILTSIVLDEAVSAIGSRYIYSKLYQDGLKDAMLSVMTDDSSEVKPKITALVCSIIYEAMFASFGIKNVNLLKIVYPEFSPVSLANVGAFAYLFASLCMNRPNEIITLLMNISDLFDNHSTDVSVAHVKCQDSYYIDDYNNNHDDKIHLVNLRENANIVHMSFFGFNDVQVYDVNNNNNKVVDVSGHVFGKSDVLKCDADYAVGYYSYITEEKMELYLPLNKKLNVSFKSYSKKLHHDVNYKTVLQNITASTNNPSLPSKNDTAWFNSDRVNITIDVKA